MNITICKTIRDIQTELLKHAALDKNGNVQKECSNVEKMDGCMRYPPKLNCNVVYLWPNNEKLRALSIVNFKSGHMLMFHENVDTRELSYTYYSHHVRYISIVDDSVILQPYIASQKTASFVR